MTDESKRAELRAVAERDACACGRPPGHIRIKTTGCGPVVAPRNDMQERLDAAEARYRRLRDAVETLRNEHRSWYPEDRPTITSRELTALLDADGGEG